MERNDEEEGKEKKGEVKAEEEEEEGGASQQRGESWSVSARWGGIHAPPRALLLYLIMHNPVEFQNKSH